MPPLAWGPGLAAKVKMLCTLGLFAAACALYRGPGSAAWFFWHPVAMGIAALPFLSVGVFFNQYNRKVAATPLAERPNEKNLLSGASRTSPLWHNLLSIGCAALAWFGNYVIYSNKEIMKKQHWTTTHGKLGMACVLGYTAMCTFGAAVLWDYPKSVPSWWKSVQRMIKPLSTGNVVAAHRLAGKVLVIGSMLACQTGWATLHGKNEDPIVANFGYAFWAPALWATVL